DIRATPPSARMSAGTRSKAITATAPASSAILACAASVTSMITPPFSISARPTLRRNDASLSSRFSLGVTIRPPLPPPRTPRLPFPFRRSSARRPRLTGSQALGEIGEREGVERGQHALVERAPQGMRHAVLLVAVGVLETLHGEERALEQRHY